MRPSVLAVVLILVGMNQSHAAIAQSQSAACDGQWVRAAWYASGKRTATGEPFNQNGLTAAHRTLPFGSRVTVTNPSNGKSVTVVVNDRGPFVRGVTIDLARGAARVIGMSGTQRVCMSTANQ